MKILFVGAGAIGSYLGGFLTRAGHDVTLIDPWAEQVETVRQKGISVTGPHDPFEARPAIYHLHEAQRLPRDFEVAFVAMKVYDTAWAAQLAVRHLTSDGFVVAAENCWPDPIVASVVGQERAVGLVMSKIGVASWKAGHVERGHERGGATGHDVFRAGEHDGKVTPRVEALAKMLSVIDGAKATDNLWGERWSKLCSNAMGNPVQAMTGLGSLEIAAKSRGREITIRLGSESARVGLALGLTIPKIGGSEAKVWAAADDPAVFAELDAKLVPKEGAGRNWRASMAQDVAKGRRSEIEQMNGYVVARGRELGVPTPLSSAVVGIVREIDTGVRKQSPAHIEQALEAAAS